MRVNLRNRCHKGYEGTRKKPYRWRF